MSRTDRKSLKILNSKGKFDSKEKSMTRSKLYDCNLMSWCGNLVWSDLVNYFSLGCRNLGFSVTEDLSKKAREARLELRKYMREVKRKNPEKNCFIEQDKLFVDGSIFTFCQSSGGVVELRNQQKSWNKSNR